LFSFWTAIQIFKYTNETVYAIWNTTAGGNSLPAVPGRSTGMYYPSEPPAAAFDNNTATDFTSYGSCNFSMMSTSCGQKTGLYLTLNSGPITLVAFYIGTNGFSAQRDPAIITIEGSNLNGSVLTHGSSWTLIYNGTTGLTIDPGRSTLGPLQILPSFSMRFASYRLLVTSKRGNETCVSYSEFVLIGYWCSKKQLHLMSQNYF
jgi:hypothetical protein